MSAAKEAYQEFLRSDFWKELSAKARQRDGKCVACGSVKKLQAHHIRYPKNWFDTTLEDLETRCRDCHRMEHGLWVCTDFDRKADEIVKCFRYQKRPPKEAWHELKALIRYDYEVMDFGEVMFQFIYYQVSYEQSAGVDDWLGNEKKRQKYWMQARRVRKSIWDRVKGSDYHTLMTGG